MEGGYHRKRGAASQGGKGRGGQAKGEKGGRPSQGAKKEKGWPPRILWENETMPQMTSDFASNGPQPFPSSTHRKSTFGQIFLGYYTLPSYALVL
jgi:hypothetical protein